MLIRLTPDGPEITPIVEHNFFQLFPSVSFPTPLTPEDVEPFGYGIYEFTNKPTAPRYKKIVEGTPVRDEASGVWMQSWIEQDMNDAEKAEADDRQSMLVRDMRNFKLNASDFTQMNDWPGDASIWLDYRQALRDLPEQSGFPWEITWPEAPV